MGKIERIVALVAVVGILLIGVISLRNDVKEVGFANQVDGFVVEKILTSSGISTSSPVDVTNPVTGGLYVDNIIVSTDSTGLATGTNFVITANGNTYGTTTVLSNAVSGLGASKTVDMNTATIKNRIVLENGAKLQAICTTANCEGAGKVKITVILKKAKNQAYIYE